VERFFIIAPALIPVAYMVGMFAYFATCTAFGRQPVVQGVNRRTFSEIIGPFVTAYFLWLIQPLERVLVAGRVSPNILTMVSLGLCGLSGIAGAVGFLATATWLYIAAGVLDILDGRLARATEQSSQAGAFLDSVSDRWGELLVLAGLAWYLRMTPWMAAAMLAIAGSMMVSYTRARGEGLGIKLDGGTMQRAERILVVSFGTLVAAWCAASASTEAIAVHVIGAALGLTGIGASATGISRWINGYRLLKGREDMACMDKKSESGSILLTSQRSGASLPRTDSRAA